MSLATLTLSGMAGLLSVMGTLLPIHKYDWSDEPQMRELLNPDAILTVVVLCVLGLLLSGGSILLVRRLECNRIVRWAVLGMASMALGLCTYRLFEVLPVYTG